MPALSVPPKGLILRHDSASHDQVKGTNEPTQIIRLDLPDDVTKDVLQSLRNKEQVKLRGAKRPVVQYGKKTIPLETASDTYPSELFTTGDADDTLYFSGKLSHTLEIKKAEKDTAKSDEALAALESTLRTLQEERASNETSIIGSKDDSKKKPSALLGASSNLRKDHLLGGLTRSAPSSPFLAASYSPRQGPTSAPVPTAMSSKDRIRLDAIRIPLVHLLAIRPLTSRGVAERLRASRDDCEKVLAKVARDTTVGDGRKELKEKSYRELDVWKFPYRTQDDRQSAIDHAIQAYDRMRVEKTDKIWQLLLPQQERGKGKVLSKLNFDKPIASQATPKHDRPGDDGNENKAEMSDREQARPRAKKEALVQKKPKDATTTPKAPVKAAPTQTKVKEGSQPSVKSSKPDGKFKSSERIEDSDEEADAAQGVTPGPSTDKKRKSDDERKTARSTQPLPSPNQPVHKASLSSSSSGSHSGNEVARHDVNHSLKSLKPQQQVKSSASRISPRPRHDTSPQKPSPLGSSPPTTSTDADNSSSSKASNQSSAPSSPPSDTDMPKSKQSNKYSPIVADRHDTASQGTTPTKRKAGVAEEERPAKRQQQSTNKPAPMTNGTSQQLKRPLLTRKVSARSSSPEKPGLKREDVIEDARRFQKYYRRYKDLYDRIAGVDEKKRDDKDMEDLWKMHQRLKEMKADIWGNWSRIEKVDTVDKVDKARAMVFT